MATGRRTPAKVLVQIWYSATQKPTNLGDAPKIPGAFNSLILFGIALQTID
jgi:hypothetical protein